MFGKLLPADIRTSIQTDKHFYLSTGILNPIQFPFICPICSAPVTEIQGKIPLCQKHQGFTKDLRSKYIWQTLFPINGLVLLSLVLITSSIIMELNLGIKNLYFFLIVLYPIIYIPRSLHNSIIEKKTHNYYRDLIGGIEFHFPNQKWQDELKRLNPHITYPMIIGPIAPKSEYYKINALFALGSLIFLIILYFG